MSARTGPALPTRRPLLLVGGGSYAVRFVHDTVLAPGALPTHTLVAVVDPNPRCLARRALPTVPCVADIAAWAVTTPASIRADTVAELAVPIAAVPGLVEQLLAVGVRQLLLPKPVALARDLYDAITDAVTSTGAQALVESNWWYARLTRVVAERVHTLRARGGLRRATLEYSKRTTKVVPLPPLEAEFPHALQIAICVGLLDPTEDFPLDVTRDARQVVARYRPLRVPGGVTLTSETHRPDGRIRRLTVWDDDPTTPALIADFDVAYDVASDVSPDSPTARAAGRDPTGRATRHGTVWSRDIEGARPPRVVADHVMRTMYHAMLWPAGGTPRLTLDRYRTTAEQLIRLAER